MSDERGADLSPCGRYRYTLWRGWGTGGTVAFVGLNPSTADATLDDPTIRRCVGYARAWGYGALMMVNLFAWRATNPRHMMAADDPVGPGNDDALRAVYANAKLTVAAWGAHGKHRGRDAAVRQMLPTLHYLRLTKDGNPGHPLYLPANLRPVRFAAPGARCEACRATGALHCSDPANCGGPWTDAVLPAPIDQPPGEQK